MRQKKYRKPEGYEPPGDASELLDRYRRGERFFEGAQLRGAVFANEPPLEDVNLIGADLSGAHAKYASFFGVDFTHSACVGTNFEKARLYRCSFAHADLRSAWMYYTQIAFVSFFATEMEGARYLETVAARDTDEARLASGRMSARPEAASCFVSYSTQDPFPEEVGEALHRAGIPNWFMPRSSYFDSYISENLTRAIAMCEVFALILSDNALDSRWVENEVKSVLRLHSDTGAPRIVVLRTDQTRLPKESPFATLEHHECIDCEDRTEGVDKLIRLLTKSATSETSE